MLDGDEVSRFDEKPEFTNEWINGGYFLFRRTFLSYLSTDESCILERTPLVKLAEDKQLSIFRHRGFWACMDTQRDLDQLSRRWASGDAPWAIWSGGRLLDGRASGVDCES
jgi:glucose-1-phosphate cytidylyltransferase